MHYTIIPVLIITLIQKVFSFNCEIASTEQKCQQLKGCYWEDSSCTGTFTPECILKNCKFIYPRGSNSTSKATGTPDKPFKTLDEAINRAGRGNVELFVVGDDIEPKPIVQVTEFTTSLSKTLRIQPLFNESFFTIDFNTIFDKIKRLLPAVYTNCAIKTERPSTELWLQNAYIIGKAKSKGVSCFCFNKQNYQARFDSIRIINQVDFEYPVKLVDLSNGRFLMGFSIFENSNYQIRITTNTYKLQYFEKNEFKNIYFAEPIFIFYGMFKAVHQETKIHNVSSTSLTNYMFSMDAGPSEDTYFLFNKLSANNVSALFVEALSIKLLMFLDSLFQNFNYTLPSYHPIFRIKGLGIKDSRFYGQGNLYQNITVRYTIFEKFFILYRIKSDAFNNIKKIRLQPSEKQSYEGSQQQNQKGIVSSMSSCDFIVFTSRFTNIDSNAFHLRQSRFDIRKSYFSNQELIEQNPNYWKQFDDKDEGVTWLLVENANSMSFKSQIKFTTMGPNGGNPKYGGGVSFISEFEAYIFFKNNDFIGLTAQYGAALYLKFTLAELRLMGQEFYNNTASVNGGAVHLSDYGKVTDDQVKNYVKFWNNKYINNTAGKNGGGIYLESSNLDFLNVHFINNSAESGGGLYMISQGYNPYFHIRIGETFLTRFRKIKFIGNNATLLGPAIKAYFDIFKLVKATTKEELAEFQNNTLLLGDNSQNRTWSLDEVSLEKPEFFRIQFYSIFAFTKIDILTDLKGIVEDSTKSTLIQELFTKEVDKDYELQIKSGQSLPLIIKIDVIDKNLEKIPLIGEDEVIEFSLNPIGNKSMTEHTKFISYPAHFIEGSAYLKEQFNFVGESESKAHLIFKSKPSNHSILQDSKLSIDFTFNIHFRKCDVGDIYNEASKTCNTCPQNTYSLDDPYSKNAACSPCPSNGVCLGGANLIPKPGYFRTSNMSINFIECELKESCKGGIADGKYYPTGVCEEPFQGNGCGLCGKNSAKFGDCGNCHNCKEDTQYYVNFSIFLVIQLIVLGMAATSQGQQKDQGNRINEQVSSNESVHASVFSPRLIILKIAMNYFLILGMISYMKLDWPELVKEGFHFIPNILPTMESGFSIDCFVVLITDNYQAIPTSRLIIAVLKPILFYLIFAAISFLLRKMGLNPSKDKKKRISQIFQSQQQQNSQDVLLLFVIAIAYFHHTEIIFLLLKVFKCVNLATYEEPQYYLQSNLEVKCFESEHLYWAFGYSFPILFILALIVPVFLYKKLKNAAHHSSFPPKLQFFTHGFKKEYYYWEFILMIKKSLLTFAIILMPVGYKATSCLVSSVLICIFGYLHSRARPYKNENFNTLESLSSASLFCITSGGIVVESQYRESDFYFSYTISYIALVVSIFFIISLFLCLIQQVKTYTKIRNWFYQKYSKKQKERQHQSQM